MANGMSYVLAPLAQTYDDYVARITVTNDQLHEVLSIDLTLDELAELVLDAAGLRRHLLHAPIPYSVATGAVDEEIV